MTRRFSDPLDMDEIVAVGLRRGKRSHISITIWTPDGDRFEMKTIRSLSQEKFIELLRKTAKKMLALSEEEEATSRHGA